MLSNNKLNEIDIKSSMFSYFEDINDFNPQITKVEYVFLF